LVATSLQRILVDAGAFLNRQGKITQGSRRIKRQMRSWIPDGRQYRLRPVCVLGHKGESSRTSHSSSWVAAAAGPNAFLTRCSGQTKLFRLLSPAHLPLDNVPALSTPTASLPPPTHHCAPAVRAKGSSRVWDLISLLRLDCKPPSSRVRKHWLTVLADFDVCCHRASPQTPHRRVL
jgi:hypothetical protein